MDLVFLAPRIICLVLGAFPALAQASTSLETILAPYSKAKSIQSDFTQKKSIKKLNIAIFENRTNENGFESQIANDLIYQFTRFGNLQLTDKATADASLTGTIKSVTSKIVEALPAASVTVMVQSVYVSSDNASNAIVILPVVAIFVELEQFHP